jgi:hypothetical protein
MSSNITVWTVSQLDDGIPICELFNNAPAATTFAETCNHPWTIQRHTIGATIAPLWANTDQPRNN